jgi:predicted aspartyl protease
MRIDGAWTPDEDGVLRPVFAARLLAAADRWIEGDFLLDTGAECTMISGNMLRKLGLPSVSALRQLGGVGGMTETVLVSTRLELKRTDVGIVSIEGPFTAFTDADALELSVLGRDLLQHFAAIVDYSAQTLCLIAGRHRYSIIDE